MFLLGATLLALAAPGKPEDFWISLAPGLNGECIAIVSSHQVDRATLAAKAKGRHSVDVMVGRNLPAGCVRGTYNAIRDAGVPRIGLIPVPQRAVLAIPAGVCRVEIDGKPVNFAHYAAVARQWSRERREVELRPNPDASYRCVDRIFGVLKRASGVRLGFIGNEALSEDRK